MPRTLTIFIAMIAALALLAACGDDDDGNENGTATGDASEAATETDGTDGEEPTATEWAGSDDKTPGAEETDDASDATAPGEVPTAPPAASEGTPAIAPPSEHEFLNQFIGQDINQEECSYDLSTRLVSCPNRGDYAIDPPITGQDITCNVWIVDETPEAVHCSTVSPLQSVYYDIQ